jgi:triacylglycerol lipase
MWLAQSLLPFGWFRAQAISGAASNPRPIVVVHGYTQNRMNFVWLSRNLRKRGLGPIYGFDYFSYARVDKSARSLADFVDQVMAATGAQYVDLVCHSLGGLVARNYVDLLGGHRRVQRVVTLGTPHRGIVHSTLGLGASVLDMQPHAPLIRRLAQAPVPSAVRYHSIYSLHDNIVFPGKASSLGERGQDIVVRQYGHFGILFSSEVADHVYRALKDDTRSRQPEPVPESTESAGVDGDLEWAAS